MISTADYNAMQARLKKSAAVFVESPKTLAAECNPDFSITHCTDEQHLNKTERAYLAHLRMLYPHYVGVQNVTLKLGDDCRYTCDFNVLDENGRWVFHEVKGHMREDALVKLKVAARTFRMLTFVLVKKNGTGWDITEVKP